MDKRKRILYLIVLMIFISFCGLTAFGADMEECSKSEMDSTRTVLKNSLQSFSLTQYTDLNRKEKIHETISSVPEGNADLEIIFFKTLVCINTLSVYKKSLYILHSSLLS